MRKILYIRLDSSPLPEESDEIIVKDFNLESYFCILLGKRLLGECSITQPVSFPGRIVSDFKDSSPEIYNAIIAQWENILVLLLTTIDVQEQCFEIHIPFAYYEWLSHHENTDYRKIGKIQSSCFCFKGELLYNELVTCVLMKRLRFTLSKIADSLEHIVISIPVVKNGTQFISYIMQLNSNFNYSDVIDRQMFIDTYIAPKRIEEKKNALETIYDLSSLHEGRIRIRNKKTKKYGFIDDQMELVVPCEYDLCGHFVDGFAFAYKKGMGCKIDKMGNRHDLPSYDYYEVYGFSDGLARVRKDKEGNYAYINSEGKEIINLQCGCGEFKEGLARIVHDNGEYGFIDKTGAEVIRCRFDYASDFSEGLARVEINDKHGFIDKTGKMVIPCKYESAGDFSEGLARVVVNNKEGFIDKSGEIIIPCRFDWVQSFSEGLAAVFKNGNNSRTYFIDKLGNTIFSSIGLCSSFSDGMAATYNGEKVGYINNTGRIVIPNRYALRTGDNDYHFSNGLALVAKELFGPRHFINKKGEVVVPSNKYRDKRPFHDGLACVDGGYINNKGDEIIPPGILYGQRSDFSEGMAWITIFINGTMRYALIKKEWFM